MASRITTTQFDLFTGAPITRTRFRFAPGEYEALRDMAESHRLECEFHYESIAKTGAPSVIYERPDAHERHTQRYALGLTHKSWYESRITTITYSDPWPLHDTDGNITRNEAHSVVACRHCEEYGYVQEYDFGPQDCESCGRLVIQRNPRNGWRGYFLDDPQNGEYNDCSQICVACFQEYLFSNGIPAHKFSERSIPCDFFDTTDLRARGYVRLDEATDTDAMFSGASISNNPAKFCDQMIELIDQGWQIVIDSGMVGLGNSAPDTVDVWVKRAEINEAQTIAA